MLCPLPQSIAAPGSESETLTPVTATDPLLTSLIVPVTAYVCTCECVTVTFQVNEPAPPSARASEALSPYVASDAPATLTCLSIAQVCWILDVPAASFCTLSVGVGPSFGSKQNSTWLICGFCPPPLSGGVRPAVGARRKPS